MLHKGTFSIHFQLTHSIIQNNEYKIGATVYLDYRLIYLPQSILPITRSKQFHLNTRPLR